MTLSKRGDYVMRAAIYLARTSTETPRKIREVVAETEVPSAYASQILSDLVRAGVATSRAGRGGGYQLSRDPTTITALEIVEAAEGPLAAERCALGAGPCKWESVCPLHETWFAATQQVRDVLAHTSLAELASRDESIEAGSYAPTNSHRKNPLSLQVSDFVFVERAVREVSTALTCIGSSAAAVMLRSMSFDPIAGTSPEIEATVATDGEASDSEPTRFQMVWRIRSDEGDSHGECGLIVTEVDEVRSQLSATVEWHQETGALEIAAAERHARRFIRSLLRELAREIEEPLSAR